jgi:hypothetical protein
MEPAFLARNVESIEIIWIRNVIGESNRTCEIQTPSKQAPRSRAAAMEKYTQNLTTQLARDMTPWLWFRLPGI